LDALGLFAQRQVPFVELRAAAGEVGFAGLQGGLAASLLDLALPDAGVRGLELAGKIRHPGGAGAELGRLSLHFGPVAGQVRFALPQIRLLVGQRLGPGGKFTRTLRDSRGFGLHAGALALGCLVQGLAFGDSLGELRFQRADLVHAVVEIAFERLQAGAAADEFALHALETGGLLGEDVLLVIQVAGVLVALRLNGLQVALPLRKCGLTRLDAAFALVERDAAVVARVAGSRQASRLVVEFGLELFQAMSAGRDIALDIAQR